MIHPKQIRQPHQTHSELSIDEEFQKFFGGFLELLQNKLLKHEVIGKNYSYSYYTCGHQLHDPRNPKWKPYQHLEWYCEKTRFDFLTVKSIIEDRIGRKFQCECDLLRDDQARRRMELRDMYGVDFGGLGMKELDIV
jgi:hypothetical protein